VRNSNTVLLDAASEQVGRDFLFAGRAPVEAVDEDIGINQRRHARTGGLLQQWISLLPAKAVYGDNIRNVIDWGRVTGFDWDEGNARKSADKHSVTQAQAEQVFFNEPLLLVADPKHSRREPRFHALGKTDEGRLLHITFTVPAAGRLIRVISARDMHRKERTVYGEAKKDAT
jgi:uncharacterized DUF497 family protein